MTAFVRGFHAATFNTNSVQPPGTQGVLTVINWVAWIVFALCAIGLLIAAGRVAIMHRRGQSMEDTGLGGPIIGCIVGSCAGLVVGALTN